jgi:hypothetical protein
MTLLLEVLAFGALLLFQSEIEVNRLWRHTRCIRLTPTFIPDLFGRELASHSDLLFCELIELTKRCKEGR